MKKATLYILVFALLVITVGCSAESAASSGGGNGGEGKTLDPCALLTDAEVQTALGGTTFETHSRAQFDFVTCQYLGEGKSNLFIQVRTDRTIADRDSSMYEDAQAFWDSFYGDLESAKSEQISETSYYAELSESFDDTEFELSVLVEELPDLGESALFYIVEGAPVQLWLYDDYAVFSLSLTLNSDEQGLEKERLITVAESILASMP